MEEGTIIDNQTVSLNSPSTPEPIIPKLPFKVKQAPILEEGVLTQRQTTLSPFNTQRLFATMAKGAYSPAIVKSTLEGQGWIDDKDLSDHRHRVYYNPEMDKAVVSSRGTKIDDVHDLLTDLAIVLGQESKTPQFKKTDRVVVDTVKKYGQKNVSLTGHSKSGLEMIETGERYNLPTYVFNPATMPSRVDLWKPHVAGKLVYDYLQGNKQPKKNINIYTTGVDPVSMYSSLLFDKYNVKLIKPKYHFDTHGIDNFL